MCICLGMSIYSYVYVLLLFLPFCLLVVFLPFFTFLYYKVINPTYFSSKIQAAVDAVEATGSNGADLEQVRNTASFVFNAFTHSTLTLFGLMVIGFFYTLILTLLFRYKPKAFGL